MKKILMILLAVVLAISMLTFGVGCKAEAPAKEAEEKAVEEEAAEEEIAEEAEPERVQEIEFVSVVSPDYPQYDQWMEIADAYMEEHPNVKITRTFIEYAEFFTQIGLRAAGGNPPALAQHGYSTPELVALDALVETGPYLEKYGWSEDDFPQGIWDLTVYNGKQYGVPYTLDTRTLHYNKDMLDELGLNPPETWDDLIEMAPKIKDATGASALTVQAPTPVNMVWEFMTVILFSNGGEWIIQGEDGLWKANALSPEVLEAVEVAKKLYDNKVLIADWLTNPEPVYHFLHEEVAMFMAGNWNFETYDSEREKGTFDFEIGQVLYPKIKEHASTLGGWAWYAFKSDKWDDEVTMDIINYFLQNTDKHWYDSMPPTNAAMELLFAEDPRYETIVEQLKTAKFPMKVIQGYWELLEVIYEYTSEAILGETPIDQAMQEMDVKMQEVLDREENAAILGEK